MRIYTVEVHFGKVCGLGPAFLGKARFGPVTGAFIIELSCTGAVRTLAREKNYAVAHIARRHRRRNEPGRALERFAEEADFDVFLLAGRADAFEQHRLRSYRGVDLFCVAHFLRMRKI